MVANEFGGKLEHVVWITTDELNKGEGMKQSGRVLRRLHMVLKQWIGFGKSWKEGTKCGDAIAIQVGKPKYC